MTGRWPGVTVVIPTRGRPAQLKRAVGTVLSQRYPGQVECIVVFDREDPRRVEAPLSEGRSLRLLSNDRAPGPAGARNVGALAARGEVLAFCDDDDEWLDGKLSLQVETLQRARQASAVACGLRFRYRGREFERLSRTDRVELEDLLSGRRADLAPSSIVVGRDAFLQRIGPFDEALPGGYAEDYDWLLRAAAVGPLITIRRALVLVNRDESHFMGRWDLITRASEYLLAKHPQLWHHRRNVGRMYGRMAFGSAASGDRREARVLARRAIAADWRQPRGYLALLVSAGIVPASSVVRLTQALGRGV